MFSLKWEYFRETNISGWFVPLPAFCNQVFITDVVQFLLGETSQVINYVNFLLMSMDVMHFLGLVVGGGGCQSKLCGKVEFLHGYPRGQIVLGVVWDTNANGQVQSLLTLVNKANDLKRLLLWSQQILLGHWVKVMAFRIIIRNWDIWYWWIRLRFIAD